MARFNISTYSILLLALAALLPSPTESALFPRPIHLTAPSARPNLVVASARTSPKAGRASRDSNEYIRSGPEPGIVACLGSLSFLAAGGLLGCAPRVIAGLTTALVVSAPIQILDIAIMENASGKRKMADALRAGSARFIGKPMEFLRSQETALVYCLFGATYATANICKALATPIAGTLALTTMANMGACFYKDSELARLCGQGPRHDFPKLGYANLAMRDLLSMGSTFTLPPVITALLKTVGVQGKVVVNTAQLLCPVIAQTVQVPFHLTALSLYNHPEWTRAERWESMKTLYVPTLLARMARALPCYGAGGVFNANLQTVAMSIGGGR